jgi:predicted benzoate:H+ symporter BenE
MTVDGLVGGTSSAAMVYQAALMPLRRSGPELITFPVTASGLTLVGIGSAFRGFVVRPGGTEDQPAPAGMIT